MPPIPLMRFGTLQPFLRYASACDERTLTVAEDAGLPLQVISDPDALISGERALHVANALSRKLSMADFGWRVGESTDLAELGAFGLRILEAPTLHAALARAAEEFSQFNSACVLRLEVEDGVICLQHLLERSERDEVAGQAQQFALSLLLNIVRRYAGPQWRPGRSKLPANVFSYIPAEEAERNRLRPSDRCEASVTIAASLLGLPLRSGAAGSGNGADWKGKPKLSHEFVQSVECVIHSMFGSGKITADRVAKTGQMSVRSLHREMAARDASFGHTLNRLRLRRAHTLLTASSMKIGEIADFLGYAEQSNFNHAFRRWTGASPGAYRALSRASSAR
ncbi:helix-turn-helix domain-containing protein [Methylocella sp.]|uniref:AraC family transcriptional regulator n=1 Tax=Methylocella sp. TaxID=1978226 RepID=UPI00378407E2